MSKQIIYLDNAATSWPKPAPVTKAMNHFVEEVGANPGRSGHRLSIEAGRIVYETREVLAKLFNLDDPQRVIFTSNVTEALNLVLQGMLTPGDHVITSSMEHNALMRPLRALEEDGVDVSVLQCSPEGFLNPEAIEQEIRPDTVMIALVHASNVVGTLLPVRAAGHIARERGLLLLVDAAQTAGALPIDMEEACIDLLAFTGHKSLGGPMGTGGLCIGERVQPARIEPFERGGTGSNSESEEQPDFLPDKYESGTLNAVGLAGLGAGVRWVLERGVEAIRAHEVALTQQLLDGLKDTPYITLYGGEEASLQTATVSLNVEDMDPSRAAMMLDQGFSIMCRSGLHCAPAAHRTIGTFPRGTVRLSLGCFNTEEQIDRTLQALARISGSR